MSDRYTNEERQVGTLIGKVDEYGKAWWGGGHFSGWVPLEEARKLLDVKIDLIEPMIMSENGMADGSRFRAVVDIETGYVFQVASDGWTEHNYNESLIDWTADIVDESAGELQIGSVIALGHKEKAMVQIRPREGVTVGGDALLPWICAASSMDSSWATLWKQCSTRAVCENTAEMAFRERTGTYRIKHTKNSKVRLAEARQAVGFFFENVDKFVEDVERLQDVTLSVGMFDKILSKLIPITGPNGEHLSSSATTRRESQRAAIRNLYDHDDRVTPYAGTAWGVVQAVNTYHAHVATVKVRKGFDTPNRVDAQALNLVNGKTGDQDARVISCIDSVFRAAGRTPIFA